MSKVTKIRGATVRDLYGAWVSHIAGDGRYGARSLKRWRKVAVGCVDGCTAYDFTREHDYHDSHIDPRESGRDGESRGVRTDNGWPTFWFDMERTVPRVRSCHNKYDSQAGALIAEAERAEVAISFRLSDEDTHTLRERQQSTGLARCVDRDGAEFVGIIDSSTGRVIARAGAVKPMSKRDTPKEDQQ